MKEGTPASGYDVIAYPSGFYTQTHPDRLATVAHLFGLSTPPVRQARVLELGCGDGMNLLNLAYILPEAQFVGVDLAEKPIARGTAAAARAQLDNVELHCADVLALGDALGTFDYIIAHGLYSWVPPEVRDGVMRLCQSSLAPNGVAYVSYNAYPGNHFRDLARGIMRFHISQFEDPETQINQARSVLKFITGSQPDPDLYRLVLEKQLARLTEYNDSAFYHDDLSAQNQPFYFYQFIEHAERHGMQYLGEADFGDMREDSYLPKTEAALRQVSGNVIAREQYLDLLRNRAFRQTLICRQDLSLKRSAFGTRIRPLYAGANLEPQEITNPGAVYFPGPKGGLETNHPVEQFVLNHLGSRWPEAIAVEELIRLAEEAFAENPDTVSGDNISSLLLLGYESGPVTLHTLPPPCTSSVSERPRASRLARTLMADSPRVPTLRHQVMRLDDALGKQLLSLLNGENDHDTILENLITFSQQAETPPQIDLETFKAQLAKNLQSLARTAIMEPVDAP